MFEKKKIVSHHQAVIRNQKIEYTVTFENFLIRDKLGNEEISTSVFAYERTDISEAERRARPVLMAYNGGPGVASVPVHIGVLSPRRMNMKNITEMGFVPPYEMEDNHESILDVCDFIIYDMPMTGFSRMYSEAACKKYFQVDKDADAAIYTLRRWLTSHNRWNSPIFLMGESYGSIRNAVMADRMPFGLEMDHSSSLLQVAGVVSLGTTFTFGTDKYPIPQVILQFVPMAAANWNYRREGKPDLETFLEEANEFSYNEYLPALALGNRMDAERQRRVAEKLSYFTGLSVERLLSDNLVIDRFSFCADGFADLGFSIGINDCRFTGPLQKAASNLMDFFDKDVSNNMPMSMQVRCWNEYLRNELQVDIDEEYEQFCNYPDVTWDYNGGKHPGEALYAAMMRNPEMRVMFGCGYFDMLTPMSYAKYVAAYHHLPVDRLDWYTYNAGHMPYMGSNNSDKFCCDLREFISRCLHRQ